jgi:hypothetical protein
MEADRVCIRDCVCVFVRVCADSVVVVERVSRSLTLSMIPANGQRFSASIIVTVGPRECLQLCLCL